MLIDWFTVGAQALNFLVLVWLMKRFLYKPVLKAIDDREKSIAAKIAEADKKMADAEKESGEFKKKNEEFDRQRAGLLSKAGDEAKTERSRLMDEAKKAADALSAKRQEARKNEESSLRGEIKLRVQKEVFSTARQVLTDLSGAGIEEQVCGVFIGRLKKLDDKSKEILGGALKKASDPAIVRSAFDLPEKQRGEIQNALNEVFSAEIRVKFETAPDLIGGIELGAGGQKISWSIEDYLASLEKNIGGLFKEKQDAEVSVKTEADTKTKNTPEPDNKTGREKAKP